MKNRGEEGRIKGETLSGGSHASPRSLSVEFVIPGFPASMNAVYNILFAQRRVELKPDVRRWKTTAKLFMPPLPEGWGERGADGKADCKYGVKLEFYGLWLCKNGNVRRVDVSNLLKVTLDAIAERYGFDDARIWEWEARKKEDGAERIEGTLYRI